MVLVVFGFFTVLVALGVTATTTVHEPTFTPLTFVPVTLQYFFELVFTVITTFDVDASVTDREASSALAVIDLLIFMVRGVVAATVVDVVGEVVVAPPVVTPEDESTTGAAERVTEIVYVVDETPSCAVTTTGMALAPTASEIAVEGVPEVTDEPFTLTVAFP